MTKQILIMSEYMWVLAQKNHLRDGGPSDHKVKSAPADCSLHTSHQPETVWNLDSKQAEKLAKSDG